MGVGYLGAPGEGIYQNWTLPGAGGIRHARQGKNLVSRNELTRSSVDVAIGTRWGEEGAIPGANQVRSGMV